MSKLKNWYKRLSDNEKWAASYFLMPIIIIGAIAIAPCAAILATGAMLYPLALLIRKLLDVWAEQTGNNKTENGGAVAPKVSSTGGAKEEAK